MTKKSATKHGQELDGRRGTAVWGVNALRSDALTVLLDDLVDLEKNGLNRDQCEIVQSSLKKLTNKATALPDGSFWSGTIYSELQRFEQTYIGWNSTDVGTEPEKVSKRQKHLKKLRSIRQKISKKIRKNQYIIQNELDLKFVEDMYEALGGLVKALPDTFTALGKALARFEARKVGR